MRQLIKHNPQFISREKEHIDNVVQFLKTAIPGRDLSSKELIEELIDRLSAYINAGHPINKIKSPVVSFGKHVVFPIVTYIAGVYTTSIREIDLAVVFSYAIAFILLVGIFSISMLILKKVIYQDYATAIAFREDLWDIRLLFFVGDNQRESCQPPLV